MTREEIMKLEAGRELDFIIAEKVMNLKLFDKLNPESHFGYSAKDGFINYCLLNGEKKPIPLFSTEIGAAWQVVEKMLQNAHSKEFREFREELNGIEIHLYESRLAALHICRAALLTVEPRRKEKRER